MAFTLEELYDMQNGRESGGVDSGAGEVGSTDETLTHDDTNTQTAQPSENEATSTMKETLAAPDGLDASVPAAVTMSDAESSDRVRELEAQLQEV